MRTSLAFLGFSTKDFAPYCAKIQVLFEIQFLVIQGSVWGVLRVPSACLVFQTTSFSGTKLFSS